MPSGSRRSPPRARSPPHPEVEAGTGAVTRTRASTRTLTLTLTDERPESSQAAGDVQQPRRPGTRAQPPGEARVVHAHRLDCCALAGPQCRRGVEALHSRVQLDAVRAAERVDERWVVEGEHVAQWRTPLPGEVEVRAEGSQQPATSQAVRARRSPVERLTHADSASATPSRRRPRACSTCTRPTVSLPARSATVRATRRTR